MNLSGISSIMLMGVVFGGGLVLGYKLMEALEENGYVDLKELGLTSE
jgi:hypothetical protein